MAIDAGKPSRPPSDINSRRLYLEEFEFRDWRRIHRAALGACYYTGSTANRFSSPDCHAIYVGDMLVTVFWETFWDDLGNVPEDKRELPESKLAERKLCSVTARRKFRLFNATKAKPLKAVSANAAAFTADYEGCQEWAVALVKHPDKPEGIIYPSVRHANGICVALFEEQTRCSDMEFKDMGVLHESVLVAAILTRDQIGLH